LGRKQSIRGEFASGLTAPAFTEKLKKTTIIVGEDGQ
jgi:hypothetical protein